jgi:hypothetical protein
MNARLSPATLPALILILAIQIFVPESLRAEENDVAALQATIKRLELRVKELETLLGEAEGAQRADAAPASAGWQNRKNWKRLSAGMKEGDVKGLLGGPGRVIHGAKTLWYYPNLYRGYVTFDENGHLIGWNEP